MAPSQELISFVLGSRKEGDDVSSHLAKELERIERIENSVRRIRALRNKAEADYKASLKELEGKLRELQKDCKHELRAYHADPAGGSDSFHECSICGDQT